MRTHIAMKDRGRTKRRSSSLDTLGLMLTKFLSILDIKSCRNTTISWSQNLMRQGFVAKMILGTFCLRRVVKDERMGFRGRTESMVISSGPGTMTKCAERVTMGYEAMRSARVSKLSALEGLCQCLESLTGLHFTCLGSDATRAHSLVRSLDY